MSESERSAKPGSTLTLCDGELSFATDLYQLTMAAAYHDRSPMPRATFELFVRRMPRDRNFLVFAGAEQALASLAELRFTAEQIDYLRGLPAFGRIPPGYFDALARFRFAGNVWTMREGTVFFPGEPVLRVTGTLFEAQLVETLLLSIVNFQTMIASKAARVRLAAGDGVQLAEFGGRRAHGPQAAAWVARAAFVGGFDSTSNVLAGQRLGIPVVGTMAHSFVMSYESERQAFEAYQRLFPEHTILLVDTYDTLAGVRTALALERPFRGIRLDSGDIAKLAREARRLLDENGRADAQIFASGDMNEWKVAHLIEERAPIDAFGVGTQLATSADSPSIGGIYKLVEVEEEGRTIPKFKASVGKATYPGKKQVVRRVADGRMVGDRIVPLAAAPSSGAEIPLLRPAMREGEILVDDPLPEVREHCRAQLALLPERLRGLSPVSPPYPVTIDAGLEELRTANRDRLTLSSGS